MQSVAQRRHLLKILKTGGTYFVLLFGAGFILGPLRILFVVPRVGERIAELIEAPVMLIVMIVAAKWVLRKFRIPPQREIGYLLE